MSRSDGALSAPPPRRPPSLDRPRCRICGFHRGICHNHVHLRLASPPRRPASLGPRRQLQRAAEPMEAALSVLPRTKPPHSAWLRSASFSHHLYCTKERLDDASTIRGAVSSIGEAGAVRQTPVLPLRLSKGEAPRRLPARWNSLLRCIPSAPGVGHHDKRSGSSCASTRSWCSPRCFPFPMAMMY